MLARIRAAARKDDGASAVEYGLLVAAIAALIVIVVFAMGSLVQDVFDNTCTRSTKRPERDFAQDVIQTVERGDEQAAERGSGRLGVEYGLLVAAIAAIIVASCSVSALVRDQYRDRCTASTQSCESLRP